MSGDDDNAATAVSLSDQPWLKEADLVRLFDCLDGDGSATRVVGGAIRNSLLGLPVKDIDLATTLTPDQVIARARDCDLKALPTGIPHGTVTIVSGEHSYEVTTLRRDVKTFGRHATVAFTQVWAEDAARRDFTINALYADRDGNVFDYVDGIADLDARKVRFIGDATTRIREDYLRILRFFRFTALYGGDTIDADAVTAIANNQQGLRSLSAERVWSELRKLFDAPRLMLVTDALSRTGTLDTVLQTTADHVALSRFLAIETTTDVAANPLAKLAITAIHTAQDVDAIATALKLSNRERLHLRQLHDSAIALTENKSELTAKTVLYRYGINIFRDAMRMAWASSRDATNDTRWRALFELSEQWHAPPCPVSGDDFIARGIKPGAALGRAINAFEQAWIAEDFPTEEAKIRHLLDRACERS